MKYFGIVRFVDDLKRFFPSLLRGLQRMLNICKATDTGLTFDSKMTMFIKFHHWVSCE